MRQTRPDQIEQILANAAFRELASGRARLRWLLSLVTLVLFFGFIALISTAGGILGAAIPGSSIPIGLLLALTMVAVVVILTGIYVRKSNLIFDGLARDVKREFAP